MTRGRVTGVADDRSLAQIQKGFRALVVREAGGPALAIRAGNRMPLRARGLLVLGVVEAAGTNSITLKLRNGSSLPFP